MQLDLIAKNSPFIAALKGGAAFRRKQIMQGLSARNAADDLCDSDELLGKLVNQCFWASIHVEEGRTVRGTLCICSPDQAPRARAFHESIRFSVKNLVGLLTASPRSPLAVHADKDGLAIWGILDATPMFTLRIRIAGTGTVIASEGNNVLAVLERGEVFVPKSAGNIDWIMLVAQALDRMKSFPERMKLAARLQRIVVAMHRQGHGGALVVVPTNQDTWTRHVSFANRFEDPSTLAVHNLLLELEDAERRHTELDEGRDGETPLSLLPLFAESVTAHKNLLDSLLRSIGDLSAVDGAVVIDEGLRVLGFGAKLSADEANFDVFVLDALTGQSEIIPYAELGGTRHQSAARFVFGNHEAMVFVASQDGRLTLLAWVQDRAQVAAIRRLEHFVWEASQ